MAKIEYLRSFVVVQAQFGKKLIDIESQSQEQNTKQKPISKKNFDGKNISMSKVTTLSTMDSDGKYNYKYNLEPSNLFKYM